MVTIVITSYSIHYTKLYDGYTGDPILNWYYTYGKPVGPPDGTRFRDALVSDWGGALNYEFNYRIRGTAR